MSKRTQESTEEDKQPFKFEDALRALEEKVRRLEQGNLPLEESLQQYGEAVKLISVCQSQLEHAQQRVELLSGVDAQGNAVTRSLENTSGQSLEEKQSARSRRRSAKRTNSPDEDPEENQNSLLF